MSAQLPSHGPPAAAAPAADAVLFTATGVHGRLPGLVAAFSTALPRRPDGELSPLLRDLAARHWGRVAEALPLPRLLHQTHSARVLALGAAPSCEPAAVAAPEPSPDADGAWVSLGAPRLLGVKTADCIPLLALDAVQGRYGALHAGWRGTAEGILPVLLEAWRAAGSRMEDVTLELGPHIQGCCYEVQADCLSHFDPALLRGAVRQGPGHTWLHLAAVLRAQAVRAGVPAAQVRVSTHCTYCHRLPGGRVPYASYRRASHAGQAFTETNVALIGVLAPV